MSENALVSPRRRGLCTKDKTSRWGRNLATIGVDPVACLTLSFPQGSICDMHFVTAYQWSRDGLKPVQLEYPDPPATFADFLYYNGFLNKETFHIGTSPSVSSCEISINDKQAEPKTTTEI